MNALHKFTNCHKPIKTTWMFHYSPIICLVSLLLCQLENYWLCNEVTKLPISSVYNVKPAHVPAEGDVTAFHQAAPRLLMRLTTATKGLWCWQNENAFRGTLGVELEDCLRLCWGSGNNNFLCYILRHVISVLCYKLCYVTSVLCHRLWHVISVLCYRLAYYIGFMLETLV